MKSSLPEPDSSIPPIMLLSYHFPLMRPKPMVSQVASTTERMWSMGLDEVLSTFQGVYAHEGRLRFRCVREGLGIVIYLHVSCQRIAHLAYDIYTYVM